VRAERAGARSSAMLLEDIKARWIKADALAAGRGRRGGGGGGGGPLVDYAPWANRR